MEMMMVFKGGRKGKSGKAKVSRESYIGSEGRPRGGNAKTWTDWMWVKGRSKRATKCQARAELWTDGGFEFPIRYCNPCKHRGDEIDRKRGRGRGREGLQAAC